MEGTDIIARLQQAARQLSAEAERSAGERASLESRVQQLVQQRGDAVVELARHYLPDLQSQTIESSFSEIRQELSGVLAQRDAAARQLAASAEQAQIQLDQLRNQLKNVTDKLNEFVRQREALEATVAAELAKQPKFSEFSRLAEAARGALQRDRARVLELKQMAQEKLPAYQRSALFQYLVRRRYGTPDYRSRGLIRSLDRWVAGLVDYAQARHGYDFLCRAPEVLANELQARQQEFDALVVKMQAIENELAQTTGLAKVREQGTECGRQRDALVAETKTRQDALHAIQAELQQLSSGQNKFYQAALERMQRFLGQAKTSVLEAHARQTPEPEDDRIVALIASSTSETEPLRTKLEALTSEQRTAAARVRDLQALIGRYQKANYDSTRSYFQDPFDFDALLAGFSSGQAKDEDLWQALRERQRFRPSIATQAGGLAVEALNNRALVDAALQITAAVIQAAANSSAAAGPRRAPPGDIFGSGGPWQNLPSGNPWGNTHHGGHISQRTSPPDSGSFGGGGWTGGGAPMPDPGPPSGGGDSGAGDTGGSFTTTDGF